jgi:GalNAc-alpha-(1->4)-GalNAc-alpha-(1->3)-diNAcBac-PP-undecaprenol alpha-1,4-N-acetyl-D-galactosaminyltransferase
VRLAFLVNDINANGGVERVVITLANYFVREYKYKVIIISRGEKDNNSIYEVDNNIDITYLNYKHKKGNSFYICLDELLFLRKRLINMDIDVLITTTTFHNLYFSIMKPFLKFKVIASHHEEFSSDTDKWNRLKKIFYKNLDGIVTLTSPDYEIYKKYNSNSYTIPNPLPYKRQYLYDKSSKKIITVGRLSIEKSIDYSIRAFSKLADKYPEWKLEIVGDGSDKERLLELITKLNLESRVKITGFCSNIIDKYKEAAFSVLTSQKEGFGCVLIESNAIGVPVISFDNVGPKEIVENNINGFLVEKNNENQLIEVMDKMMSDNKLRENLSKGAYEQARKYSINKICSKWNRILKEI